MTNKELQEILENFPDNMEVKTEYDSSFCEIQEELIKVEIEYETGKEILVIY